MSKYTIYGICLQCIFYTTVLAHTGNAQKKSIEEIHIPFSVENLEIEEIFSKVEGSTDFYFAYERSIINRDLRLSINLEKHTLGELLRSVSRQTTLKFRRVDEVIHVARKKANERLESVQETIKPLENDISGKITDENGQPLPGATVLENGTTNGTITDSEGRFTLTVTDENAILTFSFVGYISEEIPLNGRTQLDVTLYPDVSTLSEVVVIGYGEVERRDVTGAVSSVSEDQIKSVAVTNVREALQGQVAGVDIVRSTGTPGANVQVRIRGNRSFSATNEPLYVVDGIPYAGGTNDINPADIQSIEVLKDASATAIYGSRGANGVILITTKRGKTGKTTVSFDAFYGLTTPQNDIEVNNAEQYVALKREAFRANGAWNSPADDTGIFQDPAVELTNFQNGQSIDYQDLLYQNGYQQSYQLGISGGNENTQFNISTNYFTEQGLFRLDEFDRYNIRLNLDHKIGKKLNVGTSTALTYSNQSFENASDATFGTGRTFIDVFEGGGSTSFNMALRSSPLGNLRDENGNLNFRTYEDFTVQNPLANYEEDVYENEERRTRIFSTLYLEYQILEGLSLRSNLGLDLTSSRTGIFADRLTTFQNEGRAVSGAANTSTLAYTWDNILTYNKAFGEHDVTVTGVFGVQAQRDEFFGGYGNNQASATTSFYDLISNAENKELQSLLQEWQIASGLARINYSWADKYLVTASLRADGSSRLSEGNKWDYFPSGAIAWRISEESFIKDLNVFDDLKLRASYGVTGNTSISPYQTEGLVSRVPYQFGESEAFGYYPATIGNPDLQWEKTASFNVGIDFGLFNNRLSGTVEYYNANTTDLLLQRQIPQSTGFGSVLENVGETRNRGIEVSLKGTIFRPDDSGFGWTANVNFYRNREEIVKLFNSDEDDIGNGWFIGEPLQVWYDYDKLGIWQTNEADQAGNFDQIPGDIKVRDVNGDDAITADADRVILGTNRPDWTGSFVNNFTYKGFDLSIFLYARIGQMINSSPHGTYDATGRYNGINVDYWTPENPTNDFPRPNSGLGTGNIRFISTTRYFDGSFVKVRNISLGYDLIRVLPNSAFSKLRLYASVKDPFIFSDYDVLDPEMEGRLAPPIPRTYFLGISATF